MYRVLLGVFVFLAVVGLSLMGSEQANAGHGGGGCCGCQGAYQGCHGGGGCHGYNNCCNPCCDPCYQQCHGCYGGGSTPVPAGGDVPPPPPGADSPSDLPPGAGDAAPAPGGTAWKYNRAPVTFRTVSFRR